MYSHSRPYTFDRVVRILFSLALLAAAIYLINYLKAVLLPFGVACLIAYILEPFVQFNRKLLHLRGRLVAVFVTLFEALFLFGVLTAIAVPYIMMEFKEMGQLLQNYASSELHIPYLPQEIHLFIRRNIDLEGLSRMISKDEWMTLIEGTLKTAWGLITNSISFLLGVLNWVMVILYVIFLMIDYDRLERGLHWVVPPKYRRSVFHVARDVKRSMNHYFRGQALIALIVGILFSIGFSIVGVPLAIPLGLLIGLMNMVPYLQLASFPLTAFLCLVYSVGGGGDFWSIFGQAFLVYCVVQIIQDLFLTPKIMGKAMGLNPAIILFSLSVWGCLLGILGMIIALPMTTLVIAYYNKYISSREGAEAVANAEEIEKVKEL